MQSEGPYTYSGGKFNGPNGFTFKVEWGNGFNLDTGALAKEIAVVANRSYAEGRKSVQIKTPCPSCGFTTLCVDDSGNLVCSFLECKNPTEIANKEGRKAAEKDFKELLELANHMRVAMADIWIVSEEFDTWKKSRELE